MKTRIIATRASRKPFKYPILLYYREFVWLATDRHTGACIRNDLDLTNDFTILKNDTDTIDFEADNFISFVGQVILEN